MMDHWMICLTQLAVTYAQRMASGPPLGEHELCCYMAVCRPIEDNAKYMAGELRKREQPTEDGA